MIRARVTGVHRLLLLLLGAPGTGKGTFGRHLASEYGLVHIAIGDLLRKQIRLRSVLGSSIQRAVSNGFHVDDDIVCDLVRIELFSQSKGAILDGIPRTPVQAEFLKNIAKSSGSRLLGVYLSMDRGILIKRLLGRRHCEMCNRNYNTCSIDSNGYYMDAVLPCEDDLLKCPGCHHLKRRADDTADVIQRRLLDYDNMRENIMTALKEVPIMSFEIRRGLKDYGALKCELDAFMKNAYS
ncbi:nucleoside monophosphate kinase, putative [Babesia bigemina]|uniref:Nucleoside monophosphate kinase, putative n=1 Tax=Babesia bigemina TaxID=5866 RepID=A0A061D5K1_BABBI|nr:nucleoside monophosphate kinase, putative [Babesia bigemina]CDR94239.1 nucleoside monophosphate kinase, putative [Babesia bigemina]|eukprot:XP_012766425.1 nucleoside monophosphate kinase, putative [Babesia bigemina]